jgi:hypothetical protein
LTELRNGDPLGWVDLKDTAEDTDHLIGKRQDRLEEKGILKVSAESGILYRGALPRIPAAGKVDEDDAETPNVVR